MWSVVNVLKDGPHISDLTNRNDAQVTSFDINGKLA